MGKPMGFIEYQRKVSSEIQPKERIKNFKEFHICLPEEEQQTQGARCMDCGIPFCQSGQMLGGMASGCPLNNLIPEWNDLIYRGHWDAALARLLKTNNFPEFTSRVCPAPCEAACTNGFGGDSVAIKENERGIIEHGFANGLMQAAVPKVRTGKKVAVIGSGPAGLACADQLNKRGHTVTVFERSDRIGGLLMYGIPNMKLEKEVVKRRVSLMREEGVQFVTNADVGKNYHAEAIAAEYDAVALACGASNPRGLNAAGRDAKGIYFAVDYLRSVTKSYLDSGFADQLAISAKDKDVLVIGGGDTGNDCVGTAIRQGANSVVQLEMMPKPPESRADGNAWPEWPKILKTDYGQQEAASVFGSDPRMYQTTVKKFITNETGAVSQAVLVKLAPEKDAASGRMVMQEVSGSEFIMDTTLVLVAAGFLGSQDYIAKAFSLAQDERTNIQTVSGYQTEQDGIFCCGDARRGQSLVVWAIREGREAAAAVDQYLMGYTNLA